MPAARTRQAGALVWLYWNEQLRPFALSGEVGRDRAQPEQEKGDTSICYPQLVEMKALHACMKPVWKRGLSRARQRAGGQTTARNRWFVDSRRFGQG